MDAAARCMENTASKSFAAAGRLLLVEVVAAASKPLLAAATVAAPLIFTDTLDDVAINLTA
jgi:hypothetical protein